METFPCETECGADHRKRGRLRCALPGFSCAKWGPTDDAGRGYMGRLPVVNDDEISRLNAEGWNDFEHPPDDHEDGCPGAWYRCGFVQSLAKYERLLGDSTFSPNVLLERTDDRLVLEATQYLEMHRLRKRQQDNEIRLGSDAN